jgi:hypothetical protein
MVDEYQVNIVRRALWNWVKEGKKADQSIFSRIHQSGVDHLLDLKRAYPLEYQVYRAWHNAWDRDEYFKRHGIGIGSLGEASL